ncbi:MAG: Glu/Leu/Phe/Val dehydrogenase dimerization domain-containing protein, partial [Bacillota bacterium]
MESIFKYMQEYGYENVVLCQDERVGLKAVIAIHDTTLGPAGGGCRMWPYASEMEAIEDALRLARGMTYKYAAAGVNLGGGKAVIIGDPKKDKSEGLFRSLGRFINSLGGRYYTGEDVGTDLYDMDCIRMETPYIVTLAEESGGSGPVSPMTALGVLQGMKACVEEKLGTGSLKGLRVAVQGVGSVGIELVKLLQEEGVEMVVSDVDADRVRHTVEEYGVKAVAPEAIYDVEAEIFAPCALGAIINDETIDRMRFSIIAGSANNQLKEARHGDVLQEKGILYAPDYIINAGGAIFDADRLGLGGLNKARARKKVEQLYWA